MTGTSIAAGPRAVPRFVHEMFPVRVVFAPGARYQVPEEVSRMGLHRVLLIGGASPLQPVADALADSLGAALVARIVDIAQHVPGDRAHAAAALATKENADVAVTVGGGSATGLAKAVALATGLPVLAVPTTYAGSEMTDIWGRTDNGHKVTGRDPRVRPSTVVYDPELTLGMPADLTGTSAVNALAHCVEAAYDTQSSPVTRLLAAEGVHAISGALPAVKASPDDPDVRAALLYGAWMAGTALSTARMGIHHRLCHLLGGTFGMPHAETHAAVLPHAVAFNQRAAQLELAPVAAAMGADSAAVAATLWDLVHSLGASTGLRELGMSEDDADKAARLLAAEPGPNPRKTGTADAQELLTAAFNGERPPAA